MVVPTQFAVDSMRTTTQSLKLQRFILLLLLVSLGAASQTSYASTTDGPAALPLVLIPTAMANTPAPGITITVNSGGNLKAALNNARWWNATHLQDVRRAHNSS